MTFGAWKRIAAIAIIVLGLYAALIGVAHDIMGGSLLEAFSGAGNIMLVLASAGNMGASMLILRRRRRAGRAASRPGRQWRQGYGWIVVWIVFGVMNALEHDVVWLVFCLSNVVVYTVYAGILQALP